MTPGTVANRRRNGSETALGKVHSFFIGRNITRSRRVRWVGYVERNVEMRNAWATIFQ